MDYVLGQTFRPADRAEIDVVCESCGVRLGCCAASGHRTVKGAMRYFPTAKIVVLWPLD